MCGYDYSTKFLVSLVKSTYLTCFRIVAGFAGILGVEYIYYEYIYKYFKVSQVDLAYRSIIKSIMLIIALISTIFGIWASGGFSTLSDILSLLKCS